MKYAIDRYGIGLEKEVSADIFYNQYISQKKSRFFCPECGEPVFWSSRGGLLPDRFSHYKKTEQTPECDRRVDGHSLLNLYERVGLPVYLSVKMSNQFCLNIGFPAVGEKLLSEAAQQEIKICIANWSQQRTVFVNASNFFENYITLVPINFIPNSGENYSVTFSPEEKAIKLSKRWSAYADGFAYGGAIFTYGETGGKKIRKGDSVSPDCQYYVIARRFNPPEEIRARKLGTITLSQNTYSVYLITINVSVGNTDRYKYVKNYLRNEFDVWLLQQPPELIPLWPPVVEQGEVMVPVKSHEKIYCSVSSGNEEPNVYRYDGCKVYPLAADNKKDVHTVSFSASFQETILSVDRKYAGREIDFQIKGINHPGFEYNFLIEKENEESLIWEDITKDIFSEPFILNANAKTDMYIGGRDKLFQHIGVRERRTAITASHNSEEILFVIENGVVLHFRVKAADKVDELKEALTVNRIRESCRGEWVPVPYWIIDLLLKWKKRGAIRMFDEVKLVISSGKIPIGLLKVLHDYCVGGDITYEKR